MLILRKITKKLSSFSPFLFENIFLINHFCNIKKIFDIGHGICNNISKSSMLPLATDDASLIYQECMTILNGLRLNCSDLRGIGIQVQKLESGTVGGSHQKKSQSILNFTTSTSMKIKIFHVSFVCLIFLHRIENVLKNGIYFYQVKRKFLNFFYRDNKYKSKSS